MGGEVSDLKSAFDNVRERTYNLVDCNNASVWVPTLGKDVTVIVPSTDTVRIKSNTSQTYAAARYPIDTTGINTLYAAVGTYTGTGQARARIYGGSSTNLGQISATGSTFDVSSYDICYIELCATVSTASTGYIDYSMVIVADSAVPLEYKPYYIYKVNELEGVVDQINESINNIDTQISSMEDSVSNLNDAIYKTSYNIVNCNDTSKWVPRNSNVTISTPAEDTVRIQTEAQTYGTATYAIDVTDIDSLYVSIVSYGGTGQPRAQLTDGSSVIGVINITGSVFDVSNYNTVYINLAATLSTASDAYVDYYKILAADSTVALPYEPYIDGKESRISKAEETAEEAIMAAGVPQGKFYTIHRGARLTAPENTMPAFILARQMGFRYVETDVRYTSDRVPVLLHDATINRTARNADGSVISETINIADITYAQALTYDFGIYMGQQYASTKIPTLAEFLHWCKATGTIPVLEQKLRNNPDVDAVIEALVNAEITKNFVSLSQGVGSMKRIYDRLPQGKYVLLNTSTITQEIIDDVSESGFIEAIAGLYTSFTSELINACEQADVGLYAHDYYSYSDIYATDDYVSGYIVEEGAI